MARREYKFRLHTTQLTTLRTLLLPHVEVDPRAASRPGQEYTVRSLYFDTKNLDFYQEKLAGLRDRLKIRIRSYNEISPVAPVYLEIKRKTGATVAKRRSSVRYQDLSSFLETSDVAGCVHMLIPQEGSEENARQFLFHLHSRSLRPVISVAYEREAYLSKNDPGLRITLDKGLRCHNAGGLVSLDRSMEDYIAAPHLVILEVKTDFGIPFWLRMVLRRMALKPEPTSKYTFCIDSLAAIGDPLDMNYPRAVHSGFTQIKTPE